MCSKLLTDGGRKQQVKEILTFIISSSRWVMDEEPYFSSVRSSISCVSLMRAMSSAKSGAPQLGFLCLAVGGDEEKKTVRSVGWGEGKSPRHHLSRPFMELSSGGVRSAGPLSHHGSSVSSLSPCGSLEHSVTEHRSQAELQKHGRWDAH